jgi:SAM-dependent methyltransferase
VSSVFEFIRGAANPQTRENWVGDQIKLLSTSDRAATLLDVGAGESPFRHQIEEEGISYRSHDFSSYDPGEIDIGLQDPTWNYPRHDFVCDIMDIPEVDKFDAVLCTEVFEHIPDPVAAFRKFRRLLNPGGVVIITVPLISLMHQAPYWFQSGLSPFWFRHWSEELNFEVEELLVYGDYADLMAQEIARVVGQRGKGALGNFISRRLAGYAKRSGPLIRKGLPASIRDAGGFGCLYVGSVSQ